jgi:hypothetical protein
LYLGPPHLLELAATKKPNNFQSLYFLVAWCLGGSAFDFLVASPAMSLKHSCTLIAPVYDAIIRRLLTRVRRRNLAALPG